MDKVKLNVVRPEQIIRAEIKKAHFSVKGIGGLPGKQGEQGKQGEPGKDGLNAEIASAKATITNPGGIPEVDVALGGTPSRRTFRFDFKNIKGDKGEKGDTGKQGAQGNPGKQGLPGESAIISQATASVTNTSGTPAVNVTTSGTPNNRSFNFAFSGLKGEKGEQGKDGEKGEPGAGLMITGSVPTYEDLPTGLAPADAGHAYFVQEDGKLYVWSGTAFPKKGEGSQFKGDKGDKGADGKPATINGVNVLNLIAGENIDLQQKGSDLSINAEVPDGALRFRGTVEDYSKLPGGRNRRGDTYYTENDYIDMSTGVLYPANTAYTWVDNPGQEGKWVALGATLDTEVSAYSRRAVENSAIKRYVDSHAQTATVQGNPAILENARNNDLVDYKIFSNETAKVGGSAPFTFADTIIDGIAINGVQEVAFDMPLMLNGIDVSKDIVMLANERWGIARNVGEYVFTGNESWIGIKSNASYIRGHTIAGSSTGSGVDTNSLSSHFADTDFNRLSKLTGKAMATWQEDDGTSRIDVCLPISELASADEAGIKAWFKAKANAGNPVKVLFRQETVFEPLSETDQMQMRNLRSVAPTTTITTQAKQMVTYFTSEAKIDVDSSMSDDSENPVQNKVAKAYIDSKTIVDTSMSDTSSNAVENKTIKKYVDAKGTYVAQPTEPTNQNALWVDTDDDSSQLVMDTQMSDTSSNAVQNSAIKKYVDNADKLVKDSIDKYIKDYLKLTEVPVTFSIRPDSMGRINSQGVKAYINKTKKLGYISGYISYTPVQGGDLIAVAQLPFNVSKYFTIEYPRLGKTISGAENQSGSETLHVNSDGSCFFTCSQHVRAFAPFSLVFTSGIINFD